MFCLNAAHFQARHFQSFKANLTVDLGPEVDVAPGLVTGEVPGLVTGEVTANKSSSSSSKRDSVVFRGVTGDFLWTSEGCKG